MKCYIRKWSYVIMWGLVESLGVGIIMMVAGITTFVMLDLISHIMK